MRSRIVGLFLLFIPCISFSQDSLTLEKIMSDPSWIGTSPSNLAWDVTGDTLFFDWNPEKAPADSTYYITAKNKTPQKYDQSLTGDIVRYSRVSESKDHASMVYSLHGDLYYRQGDKVTRLTQTTESVSQPMFGFEDTRIVYRKDNNLYSRDLQTGETIQLTNFVKGQEQKGGPKPTEEEAWLKNDQLQYMEVLKERKEKKEATQNYFKEHERKELKKIYIGNQSLYNIGLSDDGQFVSYLLYKSPADSKNTIVPNYVTESGYIETMTGRKKVGEPQGSSSLYIFDRKQDSAFEIKMDKLEDIKYIPKFYKDYPKEYEALKKKDAPRTVSVSNTVWSPSGNKLLIDVRSQDHKDRWILLWDGASEKLSQVDHQHDEAWIGGPGMRSLNWINDGLIWFQSEVTGYSHLYTYSINTRKKTDLTPGNYEVQEAELSKDKKYFYITTNQVDPGQKQYYRLQISDHKQERLTQMVGASDASLSPDEQTIAFLYSYSNKPWELYLKANNPNSKSEQITHKAASKEWSAYPWRDPQVITFTARDGAKVHARIYKPRKIRPNMPAVIFVHGAGYLQNAHKWWSLYFREFMFNNLLADHGYYVMDVDYRGSAGYGRDWRTAIYRHMGGKDLTDQVDAAKYMAETYQVNSKKIGIYGGSYGGFMTLMALFTEPKVFAAGAALRSVTDWANYNHGYTSEILNEPYNDSLAYRSSSPIYYAEGLQSPLQMCHGLVDDNVHVQDIIKLTQRLIELKKQNWQLALYPMESHGFVEPSSWLDEYRRVFKIFERVLKTK